MTAGALLFARYAYPPNALGYCGGGTSRTLLEYGSAGCSDAGLAEAARTFEGAWPYLELIAHANRLPDPLDRRVVEAYWIGNELLDGVAPAELARHVDERFRGRIGRTSGRVTEAALAGAVPHHDFHVFAVYPWVGLLRTGIVDEPLDVLERCRITPARVVGVRGDVLNTIVRPLAWDGRALRLGPWIDRTARWRDDGLAFVGPPGPGEWVALHWDWVCDRLTAAQASRLTRTTNRTLAAVNRSGSTAAALA
ncbi:MAG TPA: DUF6390 family protein [Gaiellaceae bacterium]|nr:DUF6390 family protein [Gaiellaceae bacterium]